MRTSEPVERTGCIDYELYYLKKKFGDITLLSNIYSTYRIKIFSLMPKLIKRKTHTFHLESSNSNNKQV
jgi:hypothetical protein